ncbi:restriction endonuclease subunit S [Streptococcus anginosus]|uniref:restriction endonuclease subunit S n=1 Tax=Streptococcus anginosus TaxID=1328 RepID=UPI0021AB46DC|nr:restriction endonuclease subunit S [Streptococcus anginosus]MBX9076057.1 restriction endonuclease subunit S [Streptococcus anginosus]
MVVREVKLGDIITYNKGYAFKSNEYADKGKMVVRVTDFTLDSISDNDAVYVSPEDKYRKFIIKTGDILIQTVGSWANNPNSIVGKVVRVPEKCDNTYLNQNIVRIIPNKDFNNTYLYYALKANKFSLYCVLRGQGAANQASITLDTIFSFKFKAHAFSEQKKIADILSVYDNLIKNNNKRIKLLEKMAENLYKEWFVRFRFPGYENLEFVGTLPIGWQYQPISESMDFFDSKRVPLSSKQRDEMEKIYPYYGAAKLMDYVDDYLFDGEYLLLGEDGTVVTTDGFPVLQLVNDKFWVNNHAHVIRGKGNISTRFLYLTFCRFPITGVVTGSAQPKISKGRLEKLKILVPDAITMEHFNNLINPMFDEINVLKKQLIRITKQRDMLLPRLMSGKLEV